MVRRACALVLVAVLASSAAAAPAPTPWLDGGAVPDGFRPAHPPPARDHRWLSLVAIAGIYGGFTSWAYYAWYRDVAHHEFRVGGDGYFGRDTYAGGSDKLGHAWATYVLGRANTHVLRWGGWRRVPATIVGGALSWALFLGIEVKDGYFYEFSPGDFTFNTIGATLSIATELSPTLDRWIDYRVEYWPSPEYIDLWHGKYNGPHQTNSLNVAEDYSGETYFLGVHLGAAPWPKSTPRALATALHYVDVGVGYESRKYKPDAAPGTVGHQHLFLGVTIDLQYALDRLLEGRSHAGRKFAHGLLEAMAPPFTILPVAGTSRSGTPGEQF